MKSKPLSSALALVVTGSVMASTTAAARQQEIHARPFITRSLQVEKNRVIDAVCEAVFATEPCLDEVRILSQAAASAWLGWDDIAFRLVWLMAAGNLYREEILRNAGQQRVADALRGAVRRN